MSKRNYDVMKIGGSILTQPIAYSKVADTILPLRNCSLVIVVSAMSGFTDHLIQLAKKSRVRNRETVDEIVAFGEILSTKIMVSTLKSRKVDAIGLTPLDDEWPIITNSNFGDATPHLGPCRRNLKQLFNNTINSDVVVLSGFLGRDLKGNITTLGRGGSDTTALLIGHCMNWRVHLMKPPSAFGSFREYIAHRFNDDCSITVKELKKFMIEHPGFVCEKALKYIGPQDNVSIDVLPKEFKGVGIRLG